MSDTRQKCPFCNSQQILTWCRLETENTLFLGHCCKDCSKHFDTEKSIQKITPESKEIQS